MNNPNRTPALDLDRSSERPQRPDHRDGGNSRDEADRLEHRIRDLTSQLVRTEGALRREAAEREGAERALATEWSDLERLQRTGTRLTGAEGFAPLLDEILDAAITVMGADMGNVQLLDEAEELWIAAHRGFDTPFLDHFARVTAASDSLCGGALRTGERRIEPDVASSDLYAAETRRVLEEAGARAVQSTPLRTRGGEVLGVLSTHWTRPHEPSERSLRYLDLLSRQAADLIERARTEKELREANQRLLGQRERREGFLATLGHELRNPLAALDAALRVLRDGHGDRPRLEAIMAAQTKQLTRLVDDLLEVSRLTRGKVELKREEVDLVASARDAYDSVRPALESKGQRLDVTARSQVPVLADPARLRQIVANLLDNAIKYSPEGGRIRLRIERRGDEAWLTVRDEGVGIAPDVLDYIFEPFVQAEPGSGGLGIGLSLAHALAQLHGGSLSARSAGRGRGAEFEFRMPAAGAYRPRSAADDRSVPGLDGLRLLIVDDVQDAADLLGLLLSRRGCEVETAYGAREAVRKAREGRFDAALLDLALPDGDGFGVARRIRELDGDVVLFALTGFGDDQTQARVEEAGFAARLLKPVDPDAICELLEAHVRGSTA